MKIGYQIFELSRGINGTNILTKFHEDRTINVTSGVFTRQMLTAHDARHTTDKRRSQKGKSTALRCRPLIYFSFKGEGTYLNTSITKEGGCGCCHEDWTINVASRVFTGFYYSHIKKNALPLGNHVFQANVTIFELIQDINKTNLLTKFHEDWTIYVASRVLTRKKAPPPGGHVFQETKTIFELIHNIIGTNLLTKFHEDLKINVTSRVLTRKNAPPPWRPCFSTNRHRFELIQGIIGMNLLTEFHEDRTINVASRTPPLGSHVFQANVTIYELIQDINKTDLLTKFHEDWTINVASRPYIALSGKMPHPLVANFFQETKTIFKLIHDIIWTNLLKKFHEDRKINVASRVLTRKNAPPPGGHVFQPTNIILELVKGIFGMKLLTKFHKDWTINVAFRVKNAPPLGGQIIGTNFLTKFHEDRKINVDSRMLTRKNALPPWRPYIIGMNLLTKFHEDQTINVASRVLTRFYYSYIYSHVSKNTPPLGSHVFQANVTIFELIQDIIETYLLTKFHEDWTINVASSVNKGKCRWRTTDKGDHKSSP
ncbi:hypothetical protein DPMN_053459 [Dreissena polymorpha]|uniref:Uncharacterized protein n=1 Tax=Dreissena polymorpha TaxID=45954 RepID=A0A9D4CNN8_DREPO|nr:hypothetical protein DPMN_053459 [Dreissena polymorpha]